MIIGAMCLSISESRLSSAGAFSLSDYYGLNPVESAVAGGICDDEGNWRRIETTNVRIDSDDLDSGYQFLIGNGIIGASGQIIPTSGWKNPVCSVPSRNIPDVIRIGIIIDKEDSRPNQLQVKRSELLAETLAQKYQIPKQSISVPVF